jgi:molybdopterin molybdotransferase
MPNEPPSLPQLDLISAKMDQLKQCLKIVGTEFIPTTESAGRVTAQNITACRNSPSTDVSAMDGYAVRWSDIDREALPVIGTTTAGSAPLHLASKSAIRVFTGGPIPIQAECVVRREDCQESTSQVTILLPTESIALGQNIRRRGENAREGDIVIQRGELLSACRFAGTMTFHDDPKIEVFQKVRIGIINTGDELMEFGQPLETWQIRDSNGPYLESALASQPWIQTRRSKVSDHRDKTEQAIRDTLGQCDVLLLTGGVSMGDTDFVPDSIRSVGGQVVFHRIPIRPGRPILGAYGPEGQLILGLPGNPQSVAITFRRYALELIRHIAGCVRAEPVPWIQLEANDTKTLDLTWFRLVCFRQDGQLSLVTSLGSGDIASLIQSDGFVEIPPNCQAAGTRKFFAW